MATGQSSNGNNTTPGGPSVQPGVRARGGGYATANTNQMTQGGYGGNQQNGIPPVQQDNINLALGGILETGEALTTQVKVTKGYFTGDAGLLEGNNIYTGSLGTSNQDYYFNVTNTHPLSSSVATQFAVTYGDRRGSGSLCIDADGKQTLKSATQAIYQQFATLVLPEQEVSGGFHISNQGGAGQLSAGTADDFIYVLVGARARFKDELDYGNWTLKLSGSLSTSSGSGILHLTDDSKDATVSAKNSIFGRKFNIISGSSGVASGSTTQAAAHRTFGFYYPEAGFMIFSGAELSASIPGVGSGSFPAQDGATVFNTTASFDSNAGVSNVLSNYSSSHGFTPNLDNKGNPKNALKFVQCMRNIGSADQRFRSAQIQNKKSYFLTVPPGSCNFSTNPTFVSGSTSKLRHKSMYGNPNVFITTVGLHRADGRLVAVAKLSTPIIKNFGTQATIKVNLTY
jgi:hypothetical protein